MEEKDYIPKRGVMTAILRSDLSDIAVSNRTALSLFEIGKSYNVDYVIIGRLCSMLCLSEFPEQVFGAGLFTFYINEEKIHIIWDYRALKRISNDYCRETTLMICRDLSEDRIAQIKQKHSNLRIIIRSEILK